jgi:outer membrane murein-binding lipoprotein Lpp
MKNSFKTIIATAVIASTLTVTLAKLTIKPKVEQTQTTTVQTDSERQRELETEAKINAQKQADKETEDKAKWDLYSLCISNGYSTPGQTVVSDEQAVQECKAAAGIN